MVGEGLSQRLSLSREKHHRQSGWIQGENEQNELSREGQRWLIYEGQNQIDKEKLDYQKERNH